ncbi:integrase, catalytic region, zinc finger, CCHC-type containing protein [Tanacetum coccineum]
MFESIENGPLVYPTIKENGLPPDVYSLINHHQAAKDIWARVNLLMKDTKLSYQERECKLYNEFDKFTSVKVQVNKKFLNALKPKWSKFLTEVKLAKNLYTTNYDQLYAYLSQQGGHANEARMLRERYLNPLALCIAGTGTKGNATSSGGNNVAGQARVVKCYNCQGEGHMERQCTQLKRLRNSVWFKEKMLLVQAQESGQTDDLDAYDSDCDDISSAKAILIANLSSYDSDVLSEVNQENKIVNESFTAKLERYKERVKTFKQRINIDLSSHENFIDSQMDDMILNRNALKQEIESLKQTLSKHVKEKESDAHIDYIKHTQEHVDTLRELVKHARALRPLDSDLDYAYKYAKQIQEVLVYVTATCPSLTEPSEKLVAITPLNENKKVRNEEFY